MIDPTLAERGCRLLSTAIGELMEDGANDALTLGDAGALPLMADRLRAIGGDITSLAEAMAVLARRAAGAADR